MTALLDRLRQDLPAEWTAITPCDKPVCWYQDPRTVGVMIGDHALFVSFRQRGGWAGGLGRGVRRHTWADLIAAVPDAAAAVALLHAREGKPIPPVPTWATPALVTRHAERVAELTQSERHYREYLAAIDAERAILNTLTLGA